MNANLAVTTKKGLFRPSCGSLISLMSVFLGGFVVGNVGLPRAWWYRARNVSRRNRSNVNAIFPVLSYRILENIHRTLIWTTLSKRVDHCSFTNSNGFYSAGRISVLHRVGKVIQNAVLNSQSRDCFIWKPKDNSFTLDKRVFCMAFVSSLHLFVHKTRGLPHKY